MPIGKYLFKKITLLQIHSMSFRSSLLFLLAAACISTTNAAGKSYYRASVVEYEHQKYNDSTAHVNLMVNVRYCEKFIKIAKMSEADIIVFPEGGLTGPGNILFLTIPDPALQIVPNASYDEALQKLSQYAKSYSMYLAVNVLENYTDHSSSKSYRYNTNIVFDRHGALIARYRKYNLYGESLLDSPKKPEYSYFETDFGVTFGQFISFDIFHKEPALTLMTKYNVTDFIYPSKWSSELPFLTSVQTQWSWSVGNNVTLLSAGRVDLQSGSAGSGIFRGNNAHLSNLYSFTDYRRNTILIGDVPIHGQTTSGKADEVHELKIAKGSLPLKQQPGITDFVNENITLPANQTIVDFRKQICDDNLCCNFDLSVQYVNRTSSVQYKAVVFNGKRTTGAKKEFYVQICGVVLCSNGSITSCGPPAVNGVLPHYNTSFPNVTFTRIDITGNFISQDANPLPNVLLWPSNSTSSSTPGNFLINTKELKFTSNETTSSLILNSPHQIMTAAIHSRVFFRNTDNGAHMSNATMLAMILSILPLFMKYM